MIDVCGWLMIDGCRWLMIDGCRWKPREHRRRISSNASDGVDNFK